MSQQAEQTERATPDRRHAIPAAKTPVGSGRVALAGMLVALLLLALALVLGRDALVAAGAVSGEPWLDAAAEWGDELQPPGWVLVASIGLLLLGAWLLWAALWPRAKTMLVLRAGTGVFFRPRDVARIAKNTALDGDGVTDASVRASRRRVDIQLVTTGGGSTADQVRDAVGERLQVLEPAPRVRVRTKTSGGAT